MRILLIICFLYSPVFAKEGRDVLPELTSADGKQTMRALPVAVVGEKIRFRKETGKTFMAEPEKFSEQDAVQLRAWAKAMGKNPHNRVLARVRAAKTLRVLFIGNSYSFKIPKEFEKLAKSEGKKIEVDQVTKGGWTLARHAKAQDTLGKIAKGKWDVVVLQEQSQTPAFPEHQRTLIMDAAAKKLADTTRDAGAIPVFFLTWGRQNGDKQNAASFPNDTYAAMQKRLISGYKNVAAHAGGAYVVPVGEVWSTLRQMKQDEGLYTKDGSHPAKRGNYLGACVFFSALYNEKLEGDAKDIEGSESIRGAASMARLVPLPYPLQPLVKP